MTDADKDRAEGIGNQVKGRLEQGIGGITGDREQQSKGALDEAKGKAQQTLGDLRDKVADAIKGDD